MSRDLGRDVPDLEKLYARKLWADFSYPIQSSHKRWGLGGCQGGTNVHLSNVHFVLHDISALLDPSCGS